MDNLPEQLTNTPNSQEKEQGQFQQITSRYTRLFVMLLVFLVIVGVLVLLNQVSKKNITQNFNSTSKPPPETIIPTIDYKKVIQIKGNAMEPSFKNSEYYLVDRQYYKFNPIQRGDVVLFELNKRQALSPVEYVKRIIGLPNESIKISGGKVYISDILLFEDYLSPNTSTKSWFGSFTKEGVVLTVPSDEYFVLGDNRDHSSDSREWGFVPKQDILGKLTSKVKNYMPPTASPEEKALIEKFDLIDVITQKTDILHIADFCYKLPSVQNPHVNCQLNKGSNCDMKSMTLDQLKSLNQLEENAINDCVRYQSEIESKKTK